MLASCFGGGVGSDQWSEQCLDDSTVINTHVIRCCLITDLCSQPESLDEEDGRIHTNGVALKLNNSITGSLESIRPVIHTDECPTHS